MSLTALLLTGFTSINILLPPYAFTMTTVSGPTTAGIRTTPDTSFPIPAVNAPSPNLIYPQSISSPAGP